MEEIKKEDKKVSLNLSPTSLNTYYQSPLLFYLRYIAKVPDDTPVPVCYGLSGNIVHDCLEKYAKKELDKDNTCLHLATQWNKQNLTIHKDIKGRLLNQTEYLTAMLKGMHIVDQHKDHICEERISFSFKEDNEIKIGLKGIIDLQATQIHDSLPVVIDYKTSNSINQSDDFKRQALFYNFLIHKKKNLVPKRTTFHYLKLGMPKHYFFSLEDIQLFEQELHTVANEILSFGRNISKYPIGKIDDLFNSKKQACQREVSKRNLISDQISFM